MNFDDMMAQLRSEYLHDLDEKIETIHAQMNKGDSKGVLGVLHKLKGTGLTYGIPEISRLAEVSERALIESPNNLLEIGRPFLELLKGIQSERRLNRSLNLEGDPRFQNIAKRL